MQLAMTPESLSNCLIIRNNDYCLTFVKPPKSLHSKLLIATPDWDINQKAYPPAIFGLTFPFWPLIPTTLITPNPKFDTSRVISDPYKKSFILGADLGYHLESNNLNKPQIFTSLSTHPDVNIKITLDNDTKCFPNGIHPTDIRSEFLPCSQAGEVSSYVSIELPGRNPPR